MIKKFESFNEEQKYKIGDYILLFRDEWADELDIKCEIIDIRDNKIYDELADDYNIYPEYQINAFYNNIETMKIWIEKHQISRKLTTEEIAQYKEIELANKYNL